MATLTSALVLLGQEETFVDKDLLYVCGGLLVLLALVLSFAGMRIKDFPSRRVLPLILGVTAAVVVLTGFAAYKSATLRAGAAPGQQRAGRRPGRGAERRQPAVRKQRRDRSGRRHGLGHGRHTRQLGPGSGCLRQQRLRQLPHLQGGRRDRNLGSQPRRVPRVRRRQSRDQGDDRRPERRDREGLFSQRHATGLGDDALPDGDQPAGRLSLRQLPGWVRVPSGRVDRLSGDRQAQPKVDVADGKKMFASNGCSSCHTLAAANASGTIGPNLDDVIPDLSTSRHQDLDRRSEREDHARLPRRNDAAELRRHDERPAGQRPRRLPAVRRRQGLSPHASRPRAGALGADPGPGERAATLCAVNGAAAKSFHVTTFGCQMNEHDSERMKGMLAGLGYREVGERGDADLILFNTCSIRESADSRFTAHLGEAKRLKSEDPERIVGVGGCWAQSVKEEVFERFPFVDVAFGPGQIHKLAEFLTSDSLTAQGYFEFEDFAGHLPTQRQRPFQAWLQISQGCNCACSYCIVPSTRGREVSRPADELLAEVARPRRRRRPRGHAARPEREQLRPRPRPPRARALELRRAAAGRRRGRGHRADPLHEPAPEGHEGGRAARARRMRRRLRAHPPAAAIGLEPDPEGDAPHLRPRALPRPGRADP